MQFKISSVFISTWIYFMFIKKIADELKFRFDQKQLKNIKNDRFCIDNDF